MLRLTVPILGTTPVRILERARRVRSRQQGIGFAGTDIRVVQRYGLVTEYRGVIGRGILMKLGEVLSG